MTVSEDQLIPFYSTDLTGKRVLILSPHPDDETIGCGGTLALHSAAGDSVRVLILTNGAKGDMSGRFDRDTYIALRQQETRSACACLGISDIVFWSYEDRELDNAETAIWKLIELIKSYSPELIYAPSPMEFHPDHRSTANLIQKALLLCRIDTDLLFYEVNQPLQVDILVDITSVLNQKKQALQQYQSQLEEHPYDDWVLSLNRFRSMTLSNGATHAEGFLRYRSFTLKFATLNVTRWFGKPVAVSLKAISKFTIAVIVRTQGVRPLLLHEALVSISRQLNHCVAVVVLHGEAEMLTKVESVCREIDSLSWVLVHADHVGKNRSYPLNVGLQYVYTFLNDTDAVAFLDDDDIFYPIFSDKMLHAMREKDADVVCAASNRRIPGQSVEKGYQPASFLNLFVQNFIPINSYIVRLAALIKKNVFFDETLDVLEDWHFLLQLLENGFRFEAITDIISEFRIISDGNKPIKDQPEKWVHSHQYVHNYIFSNIFLLHGQTIYRSMMDQNLKIAEYQESLDLAYRRLYEFESARFNEADYLSAHPDVAEQVASGMLASGWEHWQKFGKNENRKLSAISWMSRANPVLVSIIVRTKDKPKLLERALQSIAVQTYRPIEVVLVNDGGCDLDIERLRNILGEISLVYIPIETATSRAHAINVGTSNITGRYVGFLNDDDVYYKDAVRVLCLAMDCGGWPIVYGQSVSRYYNEKGMRDAFRKDTLFAFEFDRDILLYWNVIPLHAILMDEKLLRDFGPFDESLPVCEDWDFLLKIVNRYSLKYVPELVVEHSCFDTSLSGNSPSENNNRETENIIRLKHIDNDSISLIKIHIDFALKDMRKTVIANEAEKAEYHKLWIASEAELESITLKLNESSSESERINKELEKTVAESAQLKFELEQAHEKIEKTAAESAQLKFELEQAHEKIEKTATESAQLKFELEQAHEKIEKTAAESAQLKFELEQAHKEIDQMTVESAQLKNGLEQANNELIEQTSFKFLVKRASFLILKQPARNVMKTLIHPLRTYRLFQEIRFIRNSGLFDANYYLNIYKDVRDHCRNPIQHYCEFGWKEGRNPSFQFNTRYYLNLNPDVAAKGINPYEHYIRYGKAEGRHGAVFMENPSDQTDFNPNWRLKPSGDIAESDIDSLEPCIKHGKVRVHHEISPIGVSQTIINKAIRLLNRFSPFVHEEYYRINSDVRNSGIDAATHAIRFGTFEGRPMFGPNHAAKSLGAVVIPEVISGAHTKTEDSHQLGLVEVYASSLGNIFMREIAEDLVSDLCEYGITANLKNEKSRPDNDSTASIFVAPHEFFTLGAGKNWVRDDILARAFMMNTEQLQTSWFVRALPFILMSHGVIDMCPQMTELFRQAGLPAFHFLPSVRAPKSTENVQQHPLYIALPAAARYPFSSNTCFADRPVDIAFYGNESPKRHRFFANNAGILAEFKTFIYLRPMDGGPIKSDGAESALSILAGHVSGHARITLNIHRDEFGYFEWHRIAKLGMASGSVIVSEPCLPSTIFKPGIHYLEEAERHLPNLVEWLLCSTDGQSEAERIRQNALKLVSDLNISRRITEHLCTFLKENLDR